MSLSPPTDGRPSVFELVSFESVKAGERLVLLRLRARAGSERARPDALLADDGRRMHELARLPEPATGRRRPSASSSDGFVIDSELFNARPAFAIRLHDGEILDLPDPRPRGLGREPAPPDPAAEPGEPLSEARRRALLVVQRDLEDERARHEETRGEVKRLRLELARANATIEQLTAELEEAQTEADKRELRAAQHLGEAAARLEAETARHLADVSRSAEERSALERQIEAVGEELERERRAIESLRAEASALTNARDQAERELARHQEALHLFSGALDQELESAAATAERVDAMAAQQELETQEVLKLLRRARSRNFGEASPPRPFAQWERTRRHLAQWANGDEALERPGGAPALSST